MAQSFVDVDDFASRVGCDDRSLTGLKELPPGDQLVAMDIVEQQECKNSSAVLWSAVRQVKKFTIRTRLEYLQRNLDERCQEALKKLSQPLQEGLCQQLDLSKARNLSAFVFSIIREAQMNPNNFTLAVQYVASPVTHLNGNAATRRLEPMTHSVAYAPSFGVPLTYGRDRSRSPMGAIGPTLVASPVAMQGSGLATIVSDFRLRFPIDDAAAQALSNLSAEDQFIVCGLVEKRAPRNPSAVTWSVVKHLQATPVQAKLEYVKHVVDENAYQALDNLQPHELERVFSKMDLSRVRNVSAFIWSRVKEISKNTTRPIKTEKPDPAPQARVLAQRALAQSFASGPPAKSRGRNPPTFPATLASENDENDLESVASMGLVLDKRCQAKLAELSHEEQLEILSSVDENVRNPSAFVWSRIKGR